MATTTRSDIPGYDVVRLIDELRNPVYEVRRMPSEDIFVAKVIGDEFEPHLPGQRGKLARRLSRIVGTTIGWVRIDDHGTTPDGQTFVISPLFERGSLAERLDGDPTPWADAVRWIAGASLSIGNLHAEGIALGRVRPSSILLSDDDEALVAIYGMASRRFDDGTFRYEAPEIIDGEEPSGPSDTYSLALILTTLVIGRTPVFGESLDEFVTGLEDICPEPVRAVITRSLDSNPEVRDGTGADFAYSLRGTAEEALATEFAGATVTTHFDDAELARYRIEPRATQAAPPPLLGEDVTAHPVPGDDPPGPLSDIFDMASVTAPLDPSMLADSQTSPVGESASLIEGVSEHGAASDSDPTASSGDEGGISAADALAELDMLISGATNNPFQIDAVDTAASPSQAASSAEPEPAPDSAESSDGFTGEVRTPTQEPSINTGQSHSADGVPFIATPASRLKPRSSEPNPMQAVAVRIENFWYANRRSVASALTALAVAAIGAVAVILAFRSYQDGQTAASEGAPPPTTEPVIMANLNNDVVFITEPPQTNTTTTTAPPRRRTTTTAASTTTAATPKPVDGTKGNGNGDKDEDDDEEEAPPTTESARPSSVVTVTIPPDVEEENENRRGRGRNP